MKMDSSVDQMWRVKMEDLRLTQFRKFGTSPRLLDPGTIGLKHWLLGPFWWQTGSLSFRGFGKTDPSVFR